jgi:peptidoglycan/LPS O-acetylase OafA/YrhL
MAAAVLWGTESLSAVKGKRLLLGAGGLLLADLVLHSGLFPGPFVRTLLDLPAAAGFAVIVAVAAASVLRLRILDSRTVAAAGTISYGIYLWNVPVLLILRSMGLLPLETLAALPIVIAISIGLGSLSWFAIERPAIAWGRGRQRETAATAP